MILGLDLLGLGHPRFKIGPVLKCFPDGWAFGVFAREFGDAMPKVRQLFDTGKVKAFRVQIWWSAQHKIAPLDYLKKELPRWEKLAKDYPHIDIYVSHSCEYEPTPLKEIKKRLDLVIALCPNCIPVQTPMHAKVVPGFIVEEHGSKAKAGANEIASTDGNEICQMDSDAWVTKNFKAELVLGWNAQFNGRNAHTTEPPKQRTSFPGIKYLQGTIRQMLPKGEPPKPAFDARPMKGKELYKVFAEDQKGDPRSNKPVIMIAKKMPSIDLVTFDNKVVATFPLYKDPNPHTLERYYSPGIWGFEIAEKAKALSGSEYVFIRQGGIGPIHPAFRLSGNGTYQ